MPADEEVGEEGGGMVWPAGVSPVSTKTSPQVDNAHTNGWEVTGQEWEIALIS